jgi:hypothetical protein
LIFVEWKFVSVKHSARVFTKEEPALSKKTPMNSKNIMLLALCAVVIVVTSVWFFSPYRGGDTRSQAIPRDERTANGFASHSAPAGTGEAESQKPAAPVAPRDVVTASPAGSQLEGAAVSARVTVGGQPQTLAPNEIGNYPKVHIEAKATVPVTLSFAQGEPNDPVTVYAADGGHLDNIPHGGEVLRLDGSKTINFQFQANNDNGMYRVVVNKGGQATVLQFWVGPEQPFAER